MVIPEVVTSVESQTITFRAVNTGTRSDVTDAFPKATSQNSARLVKPKDERLAKKSEPTVPMVRKHTVMIQTRSTVLSLTLILVFYLIIVF